MRTLKAVVEQDPDGKWTLTVPALPGYVACGDSEQEVLDLAREGIPLHLSWLREEGRPLPALEGEAKIVVLELAA